MNFRFLWNDLVNVERWRWTLTAVIASGKSKLTITWSVWNARTMCTSGVWSDREHREILWGNFRLWSLIRHVLIRLISFSDVFFQFKCFKCTPDGKEVFEREKIPWAIIISMAIYNLSVQSKGLSHRDYFHWRTHISHFIDKNWAYLMKPNE